MGRTLTDFSQLSKGMFRKSEPVVEVKPIPKETSAGGDDALAYFGLTGSGKRGEGRAGTVGGCDASGAKAGKDAYAALEACGIHAHPVAIRGGTDGARLSFMGLPCPNLGTGGGNYHGVHEYVSVTQMRKMVEVLVKLASAR